MTSSKLNKVETSEHSLLEHGDLPNEEVNGSQKLTILESIASMQKRIETFQRENLSKIQSLELQLKSKIQSQDSVESNSTETDSTKEVKILSNKENFKIYENQLSFLMLKITITFFLASRLSSYIINTN